MEQFLLNPNLPQNDVTLVIMSGGNYNLISKVEALGISVKTVDSCPLLAEPVNSHADMVIHHLGGNRFAAPSMNLNISSLLEMEGASIHYIEEKLGNRYPSDVLLNFARIGVKVFGRIDVMPLSLKYFFNDNGIDMINVNQGYAKCSTAVVDENSIITADASIAKAAKKAGIDVLIISQGNIVLNGYDTGFIGGCCGKVGRWKMLFTGDIYSHPDGKKISDFLYDKKIQVISLSSGPLLDIGGILPIKEVC